MSKQELTRTRAKENAVYFRVLLHKHRRKLLLSCLATIAGSVLYVVARGAPLWVTVPIAGLVIILLGMATQQVVQVRRFHELWFRWAKHSYVFAAITDYSDRWSVELQEQGETLALTEWYASPVDEELLAKVRQQLREANAAD